MVQPEEHCSTGLPYSGHVESDSRHTIPSQPSYPFYCINTAYLVDRCICPALCRSRQTLEKNVLSWALAGTGSVLFTRQVAVQPTCQYTAHALFLFLFGA